MKECAKYSIMILRTLQENWMLLLRKKTAFMDLRTLCSIYKVVVHYEIVFSIVAAIMAIGKTQGLSLLELVLFVVLIVLPQYIIVEIRLKNS